jgi:hypothetical protein
MGAEIKAYFMGTESNAVMAGFVPAFHVLLRRQGVDARDQRGHDGGEVGASQPENAVCFAWRFERRGDRR